MKWKAYLVFAGAARLVLAFNWTSERAKSTELRRPYAHLIAAAPEMYQALEVMEKEAGWRRHGGELSAEIFYCEYCIGVDMSIVIVFRIQRPAPITKVAAALRQGARRMYHPTPIITGGLCVSWGGVLPRPPLPPPKRIHICSKQRLAYTARASIAEVPEHDRRRNAFRPSWQRNRGWRVGGAPHTSRWDPILRSKYRKQSHDALGAWLGPAWGGSCPITKVARPGTLRVWGARRMSYPTPISGAGRWHLTMGLLRMATPFSTQVALSRICSKPRLRVH